MNCIFDYLYSEDEFKNGLRLMVMRSGDLTTGLLWPDYWPIYSFIVLASLSRLLVYISGGVQLGGILLTSLH
jgi:hypothetical protein